MRACPFCSKVVGPAALFLPYIVVQYELTSFWFTIFIFISALCFYRLVDSGSVLPGRSKWRFQVENRTIILRLHTLMYLIGALSRIKGVCYLWNNATFSLFSFIKKLLRWGWGGEASQNALKNWELFIIVITLSSFEKWIEWNWIVVSSDLSI